MRYASIMVVAAGAACSAHAQPLVLAHEGLAPAYRSSLERAAQYSRSHGGLSMVVSRSGEVVFEDYAAGVSPQDAHNLYSGTKSFSCALAVAASMDGLLDLDEPVSSTIGEWKDDAKRSTITVRQLLSLTSGLDAGGIGKVPGWKEALGAQLLHEPGTVFRYGPVPFQIFGEVMRRKLGSESPLEYLDRKVFDPICLEVEHWRTAKDGNPKMSAGAFLTARDWARYGQLVARGGRWDDREVLDADLLAECFVGSAANPAYGLAFWLPMRRGGTGWKGASLDTRSEDLHAAHVPDDLVMAAGVGGQKLYIVPSIELVVARQARKRVVGGWGFEDAAFLAPLFEE
jgi:CubicO group peptidase (beta-lactamase class C family)